MSKTKRSPSAIWASVDEQGRLVLPADLVERYGFTPGALVRIDEETNGLHFHRPTSGLARVYVEASGCCNLNCPMCVRRQWSEPMGLMGSPIFERLVAGLKAFSVPPTVVFGGFGEPLYHPDIAEMVSQLKGVGCRVELITNGTLLTPECSRALINAGLDLLWVSLDGATPESYQDVRAGAEFSNVIHNLRRFRASRRPGHRPMPEIGVAFVAMKRNLAELPALLRLSRQFGATRFFVTNIIPYNREMCFEILYRRVLHEVTYIPSRWTPHMDIPRMDADPDIQEVRNYLHRGDYNLSYNGDNLGRANDRCPFVERGTTAITWDGNLSPCLPLMYDHESYLNGYRRFSRRYIIGNLAEQSLIDLWNQPAYVNFRQRVQEFDFSPCTICGGCDLSQANEEDCYGNTFPTCGGCLWAQGVIQCP